MSVDVLPAKTAQGPNFKYPCVPGMKDARVPALDPLKRRDSKGVNITNFDPNCIIYDSNTDTTYLRGRLLGKVSLRFFFLRTYIAVQPSPFPCLNFT